MFLNMTKSEQQVSRLLSVIPFGGEDHHSLISLSGVHLLLIRTFVKVLLTFS